ncbi:hypothetical protein [Actinomadura sp. NTSP31]|uniref:hypothetical protein n=1 Tax=Actinomadura sp. NTSP31 TaxID=1735447 RepID=UPI0035C095D1
MAPGGQEKYVTSQGIERTRRQVLTEAKPLFRGIRDEVDDTDVGGVAFGVVGLAFLADAYAAVQNDMRRFMNDAMELMDEWGEALEGIERVWRAAEDYSTPKVVEGPGGRDVRITGPAVYQ